MKKILLVGCSRSGEIEMGACLQSLPGLQWVASSEIGRLLRAGESFGEQAANVTMLGLDATRQTLSLQDDMTVLGVDDSETFVFLVREPRACVAHLAQRKLGPLLDAFGMAQLDELRAAWPDEVAAIEGVEGELANFGRAALWWKMNYAVLSTLRERGADVMAVSYDSFIENPEPHLRAICLELDVPYSEAMLPPQSGGRSDEQWRGLLSEQQRELVEQIGGSAMRSAWTTGRRS